MAHTSLPNSHRIHNLTVRLEDMAHMEWFWPVVFLVVIVSLLASFLIWAILSPETQKNMEIPDMFLGLIG